jgi:putative addiction module killer protein
MGNFGDHRAVGDGVIEPRVDYGPGYRVYVGELQQGIVGLLWGGDKATQERDIKYARRLWKENKSVPERFERDYGP